MNVQNILKIFANLFSIIFHPILVTSIACFLVFASGHYIAVIDNSIKTSIYFIFVIMTFLIPVMFIPILYYFRLISNIQMDERKDRVLSLFIVAIMYSLSYYFMSRVVFPDILLKLILSSAASVIVCMLISSLWKISLHACGIGGLAGLLIYLNYYFGLDVRFYLILVMLVSGLVGSSRIYLSKHNSLQVYAGWLLGFIIVLVVLIFF